MLTAVNDDIVGREALELGAADFLIKPIDLGQVQTHLDVYGVLQSDLFSSSSIDSPIRNCDLVKCKARASQ